MCVTSAVKKVRKTALHHSMETPAKPSCFCFAKKRHRNAASKCPKCEPKQMYAARTIFPKLLCIRRPEKVPERCSHTDKFAQRCFGCSVQRRHLSTFWGRWPTTPLQNNSDAGVASTTSNPLILKKNFWSERDWKSPTYPGRQGTSLFNLLTRGNATLFLMSFNSSAANQLQACGPEFKELMYVTYLLPFCPINYWTKKWK